MIGLNNLRWENNKLYHGEKDTGFSVIPAEDDLWWVKWPDGVISADYYNRTRAKDHCAAIYIEGQNTGLGSP